MKNRIRILAAIMVSVMLVALASCGKNGAIKSSLPSTGSAAGTEFPEETSSSEQVQTGNSSITDPGSQLQTGSKASSAVSSAKSSSTTAKASSASKPPVSSSKPASSQAQTAKPKQIDDITWEDEDYTYKYNMYYSIDEEAYGHTIKWTNNSEQKGFGVRVKDTTKTSYAPIAAQIDGKPVTSLSGTFYKCDKMTVAPVIPSSVTSLDYTFDRCKSLTKAPAIPNKVTTMFGTFFDCAALTKAPAIPDSVESMIWTFYWCAALTEAPVIPSSVTNMLYTFNGCKSLSGTVTINTNPTAYNGCFEGTKVTRIDGKTTMAKELLATR